MQVKKLMAANGKYTKNNEEKTKWQQIGVLFIYDDGGMGAKIDCLPLSNEWDGNVKVFDMEYKQNNSSQSNNHTTPTKEFNDDVPF